MWRRFSAVKRHVALMWQPRERERLRERGGREQSRAELGVGLHASTPPASAAALCPPHLLAAAALPLPVAISCLVLPPPIVGHACCPLRSAWLSHLVRRRHCRRHGRGCLPTPAMWWPTCFAPLWRASPSSAPAAAPRPHPGGACAPATMAARSTRWWLPPPPRRSSAASTRTLGGR